MPIHAIGGTGMFVKEVQQAVLDGRADVAVHSAKDLPASTTPDGLVLAAVPERADPRDALVGSTLDALPAGGARRRPGRCGAARSSRALRPDLTFAELRGNIATRLDTRRRVRRRRGRGGRRSSASGSTTAPTELLDPSVMLPQVGQGALAVECRADDDDDPRAAAPRSTTPARTPRSTPSARSSPSSAAAATCRAARSRRRRTATT